MKKMHYLGCSASAADGTLSKTLKQIFDQLAGRHFSSKLIPKMPTGTPFRPIYTPEDQSGCPGGAIQTKLIEQSLTSRISKQVVVEQ